jgi:L,D-transpeptidase catalytic domain
LQPLFPRNLVNILLAACLAVCGGCTEQPAPPEVSLALLQDQELLGAGAATYDPAGYAAHANTLAAAKTLLEQQQQRFVWRRDLQSVAAAFRQVLASGEQLATAIEQNRAAERQALARRQLALQQQSAQLRGLAATLKDRRLTTRRLVQVDIRLSEAERFTAAGNPAAARQRLTEAEADLRAVIAVQKPLLDRFADRQQINRWRRQLDAALAASRRSGDYLIVVTKVEPGLQVYHNGIQLASYAAGLGSKGLSDKLFAGDKATPEGRYQIASKLPNSKYYRALLIDYPNAEDIRRFREAKRKGLIQPDAGIGGLIEIHGGGSLGITDGCIALDNHDMARLFEQIPTGTPVLILGATDYDNLISTSLQQFE